ncbi:MAG TPA: hypothetical protein VGO67_10430 [Verrucomicrobiae bacterium]
MISESGSTPDLKSHYCERFNCPSAKFERRALRKCLYLHARIFAPLLRLLIPGCFKRDREFIEYFGKAKSRPEAMAEIADLHYLDRAEPTIIRRSLRIRVSLRKARKLAHALLPD